MLSLDGLEDLGLREGSVLLGLHVLQLRGLAGDPEQQQQQRRDTKGYEQARGSVEDQAPTRAAMAPPIVLLVRWSSRWCIVVARAVGVGGARELRGLTGRPTRLDGTRPDGTTPNCGRRPFERRWPSAHSRPPARRFTIVDDARSLMVEEGSFVGRAALRTRDGGG